MRLRFPSAALLLLFAACCARAQEAPVVQIEAGLVRGIASSPAVVAFKNIPYAAPPEGDWRWRPPRRAASWDGEWDATAWGPRCAQIDTAGKISGVEDCLRLNVWAPAGADVPYVFDKVDAAGYEVTEAERRLVDAFARYFAAMTATGSVAADAPYWAPYDAGDPFLWLDSEIRPGSEYRKRQCDFWDWLLPQKP